ncbi:hypothetical protein GRI89_04965 [Altererythrobacter salegens]|uniref:Uncharacterized protein n=1 Tax=Croceibacterium salegens TaxID=1737568 RepID=A0A6I4SV26_9SPHN|nr:hypothetical protein [Croceibacterium salegens]MXO58890.1 hypothetical protein [Croceibacterium salegens]
MDADTIEWIIFGPLIVGMLIFSWWAMEESHRRLDDPNDDRTLYLDQLPGKLALFPTGTYRVTVIRQSGNVHAEHIVTGTAQDALAAVLATFRRAKIPAVHIGTNTETELRIGRLYHDHRGRKEGKKVGSAHIALLERAEAPALAEPSFTIQPLGFTCDCGARAEVPFAEIAEPRACPECGVDATLTPDEVAQIEAAAEEARAEALERFRAGETTIHVERKITTED